MPVKVKGPDGQTYAFPDGTTKESAIAYFKKKGISGKTAPPSAPTPAGFRQRLTEGLNLPTSLREVEQMGRTAIGMLTDFVTPGRIPETSMAVTKSTYQPVKEGFGEAREAAKNIREGGPVGANIGKAAYGIESGVMRGPGSLVGLNAVQNFGEDIGNKDLGIEPNYLGAAGDAVATLINALLLRSAKGPADETKINKLAFAGHTDPALLENTLKDLQEATRGKTPQTVGDFLETVNEAKRQMNTQSGLAMKPIAKMTTVPIDVADRIKSLIEPWMEADPEGAAVKNKILEAAKPYETKEWTYEQLDSQRSHLQQTLSSYYNKGNVAQYQELKTNPGTAIDRAIVGAIQDIVYPQMDAAAGKPKGYFQALKSRQSNLIQLEKALHDRVEILRSKTAQIQGGPRLGENVSLYQSHAGTPGMSIHKMQDVIVKPNPERVANRAVRKGFSTGNRVSQAAIYTLPIRSLMVSHEPVTPADLRERAKKNAAQ